MKRGKILLIVGPTGSGKGTLIDHVRSLHPELRLSISATTRAPRPGELEGESKYQFLSVEEFKQMIEDNQFFEWAIYGGNYYGTPKAPVLTALEEGAAIILEIEVQGARQVLEQMHADTVSVFIDAGSWEELEARVRARAPITDEELAKRHKQYDDELSFKGQANFVIENHNGQLEEAKQAFEEVVKAVLR